MLSARKSRDEGFTLVELVMSITILAVISFALFGMLLGYLRNANQTSTRLSESPDQQFVSTYWQGDVSSLGERNFQPGTASPFPSISSVWQTAADLPSGVPANCSSISGLLVGFAWRDYPAGVTDPTGTWTGSQVTVNAAVYWTKTAGAQTQLWRTRCNGSTTTTLLLARYLTARPMVVCKTSAGADTTCNSATLPASASITLHVRDLSQTVDKATGYTTTITAQRRQG